MDTETLLKEILEKHNNKRIFDHFYDGKQNMTVERILPAMREYARETNIEKDKEIERLKGLIEQVDKGWHRAFYQNVSTMTAREIHDFWVEKWNKFKTENNL